MKRICINCNTILESRVDLYDKVTRDICPDCVKQLILLDSLIRFSKQPFIGDFVEVMNPLMQFRLREGEFGRILDIPRDGIVTIHFQDGEILNGPIQAIMKVNPNRRKII